MTDPTTSLGEKERTMNATDIKDMAVVSLEEGTKLGRVEQPLFDLAARQLGALQVKGEEGTFILPFAQIQRIGTDAVTVTSSQVTQTPSSGGATDALLDLQALKRLKIVDQAGTFLGTLSDVDVDPVSGEVTKLVAHKGGLLGMGGTNTPIPSTAIVMVGQELLTVTMETEPTASVSPPVQTDDQEATATQQSADGGGSDATHSSAPSSGE